MSLSPSIVVFCGATGCGYLDWVVFFYFVVLKEFGLLRVLLKVIICSNKQWHIDTVQQ